MDFRFDLPAEAPGGLPPNPVAALNEPVTPETVARHGLSDPEYYAALRLLGRDPTLTELRVLADLWAEGRCHAHSRLLLRQLPAVPGAGAGRAAGAMAAPDGSAFVWSGGTGALAALMEAGALPAGCPAAGETWGWGAGTAVPGPTVGAAIWLAVPPPGALQEGFGHAAVALRGCGLGCAACEWAARTGLGMELDLDRLEASWPAHSYEWLGRSPHEDALLCGTPAEGAAVRAQSLRSAGWTVTELGVWSAVAGVRARHRGVLVADLPAAALVAEAPVYRPPLREPPILRERHAWKPSMVADLDSATLQASLPRMARVLAAVHARARPCLPGRRGGRVYREEAGSRRHAMCQPHRAGQTALAEAVRRLACRGAVPFAVKLDYQLGSPARSEVAHALHEMLRGLAETCRALELPVLCGAAAMDRAAPAGTEACPRVAVVGWRRGPDLPGPRAGDAAVLLGGHPHSLGASLYLETCHGTVAGHAPPVDFEAENRLRRWLMGELEVERLTGAWSLGEGGLLGAALEALHSSTEIGLHLSLRRGAEDGRWDALCWGEDQGRALLAVLPEQVGAILASAAAIGLAAEVVGTWASTDGLYLEVEGKLSSRWPRSAWQGGVA